MVNKVNQIEFYTQAATLAKAPVSKDSMRTRKLVGGTVWDGKNPEAYAASFKTKTRGEIPCMPQP